MTTRILSGCCIILALLWGCDKEKEFLAAKPNQALVLPSGLDDYDRILSYSTLFNNYADPVFGTASADEYYLPDAALNALPYSFYRNIYTWASDIYEGETLFNGGWDKSYQQVFNCNVILEGLEKLEISNTDISKYNRIKGSALFFRSWAFYNLVQNFAMPYNQATASQEPGIPLRLTSDINNRPPRASIEKCYEQILADLNTALALLPDFSQYKTQPSSVVTLGFLARIYQAMGDHNKAFDFADKFLSKFSTLTDYNTLSPSRTSSISTTFLNEEVFHTSIASTSLTARSAARIPKELYDSFREADLRKKLFFRILNNEIFYKGSYDFYGYPFSGIATDEVLLIRAECYARSQDKDAALADLNRLLKKRWSSAAVYEPVTAASADQALGVILGERKKELLFRGLRWTDLRRFNQEEQFKMTLRRIVNGKEYVLPPNDPRYALPIPLEEIQLSGIPQNKR
ncbi:RagB/SusD family nutrient uptake outer membrane protein [Niabella sp. CC-SYL272]|uniref:RagB/SusD family nutrient uptake outer membrane protein n=1 Tax=Niabella agricola TaxID=2891571 RepID=UPI001F2AEEB2|nr:RagB/SusD family nutrient uptake outer membrane protein [Niabella agricola]MCF3109618.1 RagB/SusD family nutrient uptake outer membrane protein [Niabella agricola]